VTPRAFADALAETNMPGVFNPYRDNCPLHDRPNAATVRRRNLRRCLEASLDTGVDTIWVARDLGYRGGRRTGVALTDEVHLDSAAAMMGGISLERAGAIPPETARLPMECLSAAPPRTERPVVQSVSHTKRTRSNLAAALGPSRHDPARTDRGNRTRRGTSSVSAGTSGARRATPELRRTV
jgi:hypothetical protein